MKVEKDHISDFSSVERMFYSGKLVCVLEPIKTVVLEINTTICQTVRFGKTKRISNPAAAQLQK